MHAMSFLFVKRCLKFVCAFRTYCETDIDPAHRKLSQLQAMVRYLTGKEPDMECKRKPLIALSLTCALQVKKSAITGCMYILPFYFSQKVMRCCCSKLFSMLWSQLLWKLTGPRSCSTHRGECQLLVQW